MKYSLTLNQKAVYDCGMEKDIDFSDLAILTVIKHISSISNVQVISEGEKLYYWISYTHIASELPLLGLKKDSVYRRVKKYVDLGLIIPHKSNQNNHKSYYSFTEFFDLLFTDSYGEKSEPLRKTIRSTTENNPNHTIVYEHSTSKPNTNEHIAGTSQNADSACKNKNITLPFDSEIFLDAWRMLLRQPKWKKKSQDALVLSLKMFDGLSELHSIAIIEKTIKNGWQGLFPLKPEELDEINKIETAKKIKLRDDSF